jgi:prevent-host-death family protein
MKSVGAYEAKTHFSRLIEDAARGESVAITRNGVPVAVLVPAAGQKPEPRDVIRQLRELRRGVTLGGLSVQALREEGRRG